MLERTANPGRKSLHLANDCSSDGIAHFLRALYFGDHFVRGSFAADRLDCRVNVNAALLQPLQAKRACRAKRRGETTRVLAATRGDAAHFDPLAKVRMSWARHRALRAVVGGAHVAARDFADDRLARCRSVRGKSAAPHDLVRLAARGRELVAPGRATLHELGELLRVDTHSCREVLDGERHLPCMRRAAYVKFEHSFHQSRFYRVRGNSRIGYLPKKEVMSNQHSASYVKRSPLASSTQTSYSILS